METIFYEDVKTFIVTANDPKENIVVFSKKEYDSIMETAKDLSNNSTTN